MVENLDPQLNYLKNKPKVIRWKVIAGNPKLNFWQTFDLIYDNIDLKKRQINKYDLKNRSTYLKKNMSTTVLIVK